MVAVDGQHSVVQNIVCGLPQGSCLSPILYNIYLADIVLPREVELAAFADDTAIMAVGQQHRAIGRKLNVALSLTDRYFNKWKLKLNNDKTEAVLFTFDGRKRRRPSVFPPPLHLGAANISFQSSARYLGFQLDSKLLFREHTSTTRYKTIAAAKILAPVTKRRSKISDTNRLAIAKQILLPIATYGSAIWGVTAKTHLTRLKTTFQRLVRLALGLPNRSPTVDLYRRLNKSSFEDIIVAATERLNNNMRTSPHPTLAAIPALPLPSAVPPFNALAF